MDDCSLYLVGAKKIVLWPDWDEKGRLHMAEVYRSIKRISPDTEIEIVRSYGGMKESREASLLTLQLPARKPDVTVPVIELFLKE